MADLPIISNDAQPTVIVDANNTANVANVTAIHELLVTGTKTNNNAVPTATLLSSANYIAQLIPPAWTDGNLVLGSVDLTGRERVNATLGNSEGKSLVLKTGTLVTTAVTANQVVTTYTVTAGKTFYIEYILMEGSLTVTGGGSVLLGTISYEQPSGSKGISTRIQNLAAPILIPFSEPFPVGSGVVVRIVTTPSVATSITWQGSFGGYER